MMESSITSLSALELSRAIQSRQLSCRDVMAAYLERIQALNPEFNALVSLREASVLLAEADQADAELASGRSRGWMHGFPHAVKDLADVEGLVTTSGSPIFKDLVAPIDSPHVARIREAGAIFIGKTNVPEFGFGSQSYNRVFGPTLNPYDGLSTAGGSSGGAAAGLALNLLPVADGSDLMGSLRNPAAFCNVVGFRPTPGRVPSANGFIEDLPCNGPMGRNVADTARLMATLSGYDPGYPATLAGDGDAFTAPLERDWRGARIGWLGDFDGYLSMEPGVLALCEAALEGFRSVGCVVDAADIGFPPDALWVAWLRHRQWIARGRLGALYANPDWRAELKPELIWEIEQGQALDAEAISEAAALRANFVSAIAHTFERFDFLVAPTAQVFPFAATTHWPSEIDGRKMDTYHRWMEVVIGASFAGCPAVSVPAGFGQGGLPMGIQVIGAKYRDVAVLQMAHAYEQATLWGQRKP